MELTESAKNAGADACLSVVPYYNRPTQEGLYRHFKAIHDATHFPLVIYNIPGRTGVNITDDTLARLSALPNVAGIKDATGDLARVHTLRARIQKTEPSPLEGEGRVRGGEGNAPMSTTPHLNPPPQGGRKAFSILSGEDMTAVAFNAIGGQGCISVSSNIMPRACAEVQNACLAGDFKKALMLQDKLVALHEVMFCETSPAPVKYAASLIGKCTADLRLPLVGVSDANKKALQQILSNLGLI